MPVLKWDQEDKKRYHTGVSKVVLYPDATSGGGFTNGVAWNGVTGITESPDGGEPNDFYADNIKYGSLRSAENLKGSISAFHWPSVLDNLDGRLTLPSGLVIGQQSRNKRFGLCYRTEINEGRPDAGHLLHLLYNVSLNPTEKNHEALSDNPDLTEFEWDYECLAGKENYYEYVDADDWKNVRYGFEGPVQINKKYNYDELVDAPGWCACTIAHSPINAIGGGGYNIPARLKVALKSTELLGNYEGNGAELELHYIYDIDFNTVAGQAVINNGEISNIFRLPRVSPPSDTTFYLSFKFMDGLIPMLNDQYYMSGTSMYDYSVRKTSSAIMPSAVIDSRTVRYLDKLEEILYGDPRLSSSIARLPSITQLQTYITR